MSRYKVEEAKLVDYKGHKIKEYHLDWLSGFYYDERISYGN